MADSVSMRTDLIHADAGIESLCDVSPAMHLSSTYAYTEDNKFREAYYSRINVPTVSRCEAVLSKILQAPCVTYATGLSAAYALLVHLNPRKLFLERAENGGYHGTIGVAKIVSRTTGMEVFNMEQLHAEGHQLSEGDVVWLETPLNPTSEATDISLYAKIARDHKATLVVDATFAPPPIQDPLKFGADWVMHSATKYFGGHSDLVAGVVASYDQSGIDRLLADRVYLGTVPSGHTAWLLLRSLRTYDMRISRQISNALELVTRLAAMTKSPGAKLLRVTHSSLQQDAFIKTQMPGGHSPTFAIYFQNEEQASKFPNFLHFFHHATSLGGVESLVEWRAMSDAKCDRRLVRVSVGVEDMEDLWSDMVQAINKV